MRFSTPPSLPLSDAAKDALAEAAERKKAQEAQQAQQAHSGDIPKELGGREGPDPVRFGDWEKKGIAVDF